MAYKEPQDVLDALAHAYYEERNIEAVLSCVTEDIEWIGAEKNDCAKGKAELKKLLQADFSACPDGFRVETDKPTLQQVGDDVVMITVTGVPYPAPGISVRGSLCCVKTEQGWLVANGHTSVPSAELEKASLKNALEEEQWKQKTLLDNIPGGVAMYRIKKDGSIPADYVSDGLARLCGYEDSEDFMKAAGHDTRKIILAEDFPSVAAASKAAREKGTPLSVQYRVYGKDKKPIRITLDAIIMENAQLGADDVAVFYAVQTLVSEEATKEAEQQKTLLALLNAVPAGIGVFEVDKSGITQNYMNDAFYRLLGTTRAARAPYTGANALASAHPDDAEKLKQAMKDLLDGSESVQLDYRVKNGLDEWVWLHLSALAVQRKRGSVKVNAAFYECTESKKRQLWLLQNQRAISLAEKQGKLSIWTYNIDQGIIVQPIISDELGHLGYPAYMANVPQCFLEMDSIHPEDIDKYVAAYNALADNEEKVEITYRLLNQFTGQYNWIHMFLQRMDDNDEGDRMAVGFSVQVDSQQEAIERYHTEQKLREQMYASAILYMEYNLTNSAYVGKNNLAEHYRHGRWECPTIEQYRENMSENVEAPYLEEVTEKMYAGNLLKAFEQGETRVSCDYRSKARPGRPSLWCRITAVMVKRPDTGDVMAFVYVEDIEKERERQLAIESSTSDGIEIITVIDARDGKARLVRSNYAVTPGGLGEHFAYDEAFVRRSHAGVVSENRKYGYRAALLSTVLKELETKEVYQYSISTKFGDAPEKRQLFRFRYLDDRKAQIVLSVSDITPVYREAEAKKQRLEEALAQAQEASRAKADFYSRMSHDMRTPMNGVLGMVALSEEETDSAVLKENLGKIKESGEYLLSLINDTLDIQRIESGKMTLEPTIVSTKDLVGNIIDMVNVTAKAKGVHLKYDQGSADLYGYIYVDAMRLKQVFINLLANAVKFTPTGGTVAVELKHLFREGVLSHDIVYVCDTGVGMSKEFLESGIFKPFSQERNAVSANYAGSGLGLSIAKRLVEMMGGHIDVESELGVGTTFAVHLDFERVDEEQAKAALQREKSRSEDATHLLKGKKILLAEDHPLNAEIAKKLLKKAGCEVTWVKNGQVAVSCFANAPADAFDAILMDIRMPIMDGLEATRQIRKLEKADAASVPIIAMTANAYEEDRKASHAAGMNAHLGKPIVPKELYDTLAVYVAKKGTKHRKKTK